MLLNLIFVTGVILEVIDLFTDINAAFIHSGAKFRPTRFIGAAILGVVLLHCLLSAVYGGAVLRRRREFYRRLTKTKTREALAMVCLILGLGSAPLSWDLLMDTEASLQSGCEGELARRLELKRQAVAILQTLHVLVESFPQVLLQTAVFLLDGTSGSREQCFSPCLQYYQGQGVIYQYSFDNLTKSWMISARGGINSHCNNKGTLIAFQSNGTLASLEEECSCFSTRVSGDTVMYVCRWRIENYWTIVSMIFSTISLAKNSAQDRQEKLRETYKTGLALSKFCLIMGVFQGCIGISVGLYLISIRSLSHSLYIVFLSPLVIFRVYTPGDFKHLIQNIKQTLIDNKSSDKKSKRKSSPLQLFVASLFSVTWLALSLLFEKQINIKKYVFLGEGLQKDSKMENINWGLASLEYDMAPRIMFYLHVWNASSKSFNGKCFDVSGLDDADKFFKISIQNYQSPKSNSCFNPKQIDIHNAKGMESPEEPPLKPANFHSTLKLGNYRFLQPNYSMVLYLIMIDLIFNVAYNVTLIGLTKKLKKHIVLIAIFLMPLFVVCTTLYFVLEYSEISLILKRHLDLYYFEDQGSCLFIFMKINGLARLPPTYCERLQRAKKAYLPVKFKLYSLCFGIRTLPFTALSLAIVCFFVKIVRGNEKDGNNYAESIGQKPNWIRFALIFSIAALLPYVTSMTIFGEKEKEDLLRSIRQFCDRKTQNSDTAYTRWEENHKTFFSIILLGENAIFSIYLSTLPGAALLFNLAVNRAKSKIYKRFFSFVLSIVLFLMYVISLKLIQWHGPKGRKRLDGTMERINPVTGAILPGPWKFDGQSGFNEWFGSQAPILSSFTAISSVFYFCYRESRGLGFSNHINLEEVKQNLPTLVDEFWAEIRSNNEESFTTMNVIIIIVPFIFLLWRIS